MARILNLAERHNLTRVIKATTEQETDNIWETRRTISPALFRIKPRKINEDVCVPRTKLIEHLKRVDEVREKSGLMIANFGHVGDGNIHCNILFDDADAENAEKAVDSILKTVVELGGTISGEHGIGLSKARFLSLELSPPVIALMKKIKTAFDPEGILNPGKIWI